MYVCILGNRLCIIDPEKIRIENGLDNTGNNSNWVVPFIGKVPIYPIGNIECTIYSQCEKVVGSNSLCLARPLQHE